MAEGRDITTVVAPDADVRVLLTAERGRAAGAADAEIHGGRDAAAWPPPATRSSGATGTTPRSSQFVNAADGVITVDSTALDLHEAIAAVLAVVREHAPA